jgi:flagellar FliL protein
MFGKKTDEMADIEKEVKLDESGGAGTSKKKKILLIALPILIVLAGGGIYFGLFLRAPAEDKVAGTPGAANTEAPPVAVEQQYFVPMDDLMVTLLSVGSKQSFLKLSLSLQARSQAEADAIKVKLPIIVDHMQTFLRELRASDLSGSSGVMFLKTEMAKRINQIIQPIMIQDILFKEILMGGG